MAQVKVVFVAQSQIIWATRFRRAVTCSRVQSVQSVARHLVTVARHMSHNNRARERANTIQVFDIV